MAVNKYAPHVFVVPEDDADRQFAEGFELDFRLKPLAMQVMPPAGGWRKVVDKIVEDYLPKIKSNRHTHVVGIIDCDKQSERIREELKRVPDDLRDRVFLLGTFDDPQAFKRSVNMSFEKIGVALADECYRDALNLWRNKDFLHISEEILRAKDKLRPVLFDVE